MTRPATAPVGASAAPNASVAANNGASDWLTADE
jgi:hypothetical protein